VGDVPMTQSIAPSEVFYNDEIARFLAVMVMVNPAFLEPCQALLVLFSCMDGDRVTSFLLSDMQIRLRTLQGQRPDYYEALKTFRGYVGLLAAWEDYEG